MSQDPMATFGGLLRGCISDENEREDRKAALEGAAFLLLGLASSILTAYLFAAIGVLV
ncbi:MAG: hypothetical protein LYZ66_03350 [Nitrososphaerales archaeon]|nr:hypothetical protein [Nitrososphaerales archaeon]